VALSAVLPRNDLDIGIVDPTRRNRVSVGRDQTEVIAPVALSVLATTDHSRVPVTASFLDTTPPSTVNIRSSGGDG
jgi:hypothetical protein